MHLYSYTYPCVPKLSSFFILESSYYLPHLFPATPLLPVLHQSPSINDSICSKYSSLEHAVAAAPKGAKINLLQ